MSFPNTARHSIGIALASCFCAVSVLAAQLPRPDAKALEAAQKLKGSGATASAVVREMLSGYRQTGPQTVLIMTATGYREAEIGQALAREARADAGTIASWAAAGGLQTTAAWQLTRSISASGGDATKALRASGFRTKDILFARQSLETRDFTAWAADLRYAGVAAHEAGDALGAVTAATAKTTAQEMLAAGWSVVDVAIMLRDTYDMRDDRVGQLLVDIGVDEPQVLVAWLDPGYGLAEPYAIDAFRKIGGRADHATSILRDRGRSAAQIVPMLATAGYGSTVIGEAIQGVFALAPSAVIDAMVDAGMHFAAAAEWADGDGQPEPVIVELIEAAGATATENAQALVLGGVISQGQFAAWSVWAGAAGYTCGQTALALKDAFVLPPEAAATTLPGAGCAPADIGKAVDAAYGPTLSGLAAHLVQAGFDTADLAAALMAVNNDPEAVAQAMSDAGKSMNEIADSLHGLGVTPTKLAEVLMNALNPAPLALATALKLAGVDQPEVQAVLMGLLGDPKLVLEILAQVF